MICIFNTTRKKISKATYQKKIRYAVETLSDLGMPAAEIARYLGKREGSVKRMISMLPKHRRAA